MSFAPLRDRLLVKPDTQADHVSPSGLVLQARTGISGSRDQLGRTGTVIAIGPGVRTRRGVTIPPAVRIGDRILFGEWEYAKLSGDGIEWLVIQEADIEAVIE
jgi:chaperonin GroES